ncbi:hypothetical protein DPMN_162542 [Dreissena polymorpha]|uniref:Uncharacterized protein n=1 Tax=Dreissena polymorpha TaxID=45954 RepID=A0A9D4ITT4_DREPO|nr:hypothetical protein DPMN_162542 [Dreissena polymorpha]
MPYVRRLLRVMGSISTGPEKKLANRFTMEYLRHDGVFTLRLVGKNSSDIVVAEILADLWDMYRTKKAAQIRNNTQEVEFEGEDV